MKRGIKVKYLYQQLISHMGVLLLAFLIISVVFGQYVERLVYQNKVDELVEYGENILQQLMVGTSPSTVVIQQYENVLSGRNIRFSIFDEQGNILYPTGFYVQNLRFADEVLDQIAKGDPLVVREEIEHSDEFVTLVALPYIKNNTLYGGIFLTAPISGSKAMIKQIYEYLLVTIFMAFAMSVLPSWFLSKMHVNRIKRLREATSMIAKGDYSIDLPQSDFDEISELANDFNHMVTRLRKAAEEIESLENRRRNFMSDVSHELRTPLTTISGVIEGLKNNMIAEEEKEKGINLISKETKRLIRLVNENLDYDKIRSNQIKLDIKDMQLLEVFEIIVDQLELQAKEKNNQLVIEVTEDVYVQADYDRLIQILINITKNSIQFTDNGTIILRGRWEDGFTVMEVEDTGIGIDPDEVEKIWHRFYKAEISRTNNPYGEFGLGLSIVKKLIELHHGTVKVESEKGKGAKFIIYLPYHVQVESI